MTKLASIMAVLGAAACQSGDGSTTPDPAPSGPPPTSLYAEPALDMAGSVPASALAFAYDGATFRGGYRTHDVAVTDGIVDVRPWHRDPETGQRAAGGA